MKTKVFELRDSMTCIPIMATKLIEGDTHTEAERWLLRRAGYDASHPYVLLTWLKETNRTECVPENWNDRTFQTAHQHIVENWYALVSGEVIDVEFILGETTEVKKTDRLAPYGEEPQDDN